MSDRNDRISEEVKKELSLILRDDIKDPRLPEMVSVLNVKVTNDLKFAKAYISVFGDEEARKKAEAALVSASGFIRKEISKRLNLRATPEFSFIIDNSIEKGINMSKLIHQIIEDDKIKHVEQDIPEGKDDK